MSDSGTVDLEHGYQAKINDTPKSKKWRYQLIDPTGQTVAEASRLPNKKACLKAAKAAMNQRRKTMANDDQQRARV